MSYHSYSLFQNYLRFGYNTNESYLNNGIEFDNEIDFNLNDEEFNVYDEIGRERFFSFITDEIGFYNGIYFNRNDEEFNVDNQNEGEGLNSSITVKSFEYKSINPESPEDKSRNDAPSREEGVNCQKSMIEKENLEDIEKKKTEVGNEINKNLGEKENSGVLNINRENKKDSGFTKKKRGRKKKDSGEKGDHTNEDEDNLIKANKVHLIKSIRTFINKKINIPGKKLKTIKGDISKDGKVQSNLELLKMEIRKIVSQNFYRNEQNKDNNKNIINLMEKDDEFKKIFDKTFSQCLKHCRSKISKDLFILNNNESDPDFDEDLVGLEDIFLKEIKEVVLIGKSINYADKFMDVFYKFEEIFKNKVSRTSNKK